MQILSELKEYAQNSDVPIIQDETLQFLLDLVEKKKITSILEIGTAIGYSALWMSTIASVQKIVTLERNYGLAQIAQANIKRAGQSKVIQVINEDALNYSATDKFDLLFIDGAKAQYQKFFDRYCANAEYIVVDNIDFHGMVENPSLTTNRNTRAMVKKIAKFKEAMLENQDYDCRYYAKGDGILLITKRK